MKRKINTMLSLKQYLMLFFTFYMALKADGQNVGINTTLPGSKLTVNGSLASNYKVVTANTTLGTADYYTVYNGSTAGIITLPAAITGTGNFKGRIYSIKNSSSIALTVTASGSEQIDDIADVSSFVIPPGYHAKFISKGTTTGTTWELYMLTRGREDSITQVSGTPYSIPSGTPSGTSFLVNANGYSIVPGSSSTFTLPVAKPLFLSFSLGIDEAGGLSPNYPYIRCEIFIDGVATGLYQIIQEIGKGYQFQLNISGVQNLSAGPHTIDARVIRWYNDGIASSNNQTFVTLSTNFDAVYLN